MILKFENRFRFRLMAYQHLVNHLMQTQVRLGFYVCILCFSEMNFIIIIIAVSKVVFVFINCTHVKFFFRFWKADVSFEKLKILSDCPW